MKILITGGSGFIGKNLIPILLQNNHKITLIVKNNLKIKDQKWIRRVSLIRADLFNNKTLFLNEKFDVLIHLAWSNLDNYNHINHKKKLKFHKNFINLAIKNKIDHFIFSGTCQEYGLREGELKEEMNANPSTNYSISKNNLRKFVFRKNIKNKLCIQWLRIFYIMGKYQNKNTLFGQLESDLNSKKKYFKMSSGEQIRDYLEIKELCKIISKLIKNKNINGIINVCSGKPIKIIDLIKKKIKKKKILLLKNYYSMPKYEPKSFWGSTNKLKKLFKK